MFRNLNLTKVATLAVSAPALVAFVVSFEHLREVAEFAGEGWRSWLLPLSVDGLVIAASIAALNARRQGREVPWMTIVNLLVGLGVSVAANVLVPFLDVLVPQSRDILSASVAAWPAVALALAFEELLRLRGSVTPEAEVPQHAEPAAEAEPVAEAEVPAVAEVPAEAEAEPAGDVPVITALGGASVREQAIAEVKRNPEITGRELGELFPRAGVPRSDSWGRQIKRAVAAIG